MLVRIGEILEAEQRLDEALREERAASDAGNQPRTKNEFGITTLHLSPAYLDRQERARNAVQRAEENLRALWRAAVEG
ncbi:hypothetical protein [Kribbella sp. NPDC004536]|uniref:hypothetical protein n=1 Tax=Kribbella sp. NPDC004536 TaxID=3364106 RepID=UPI00367A1CD6